MILEEAFLEADVTGTGTAVAAIVRERPITAAVTGTGTVTAAIIEVAYVAGAITGTGTLNQPIIIRKVPQPELTLSVTNITGTGNAEEKQHTLELLVGV